MTIQFGIGAFRLWWSWPNRAEEKAAAVLWPKVETDPTWLSAVVAGLQSDWLVLFELLTFINWRYERGLHMPSIKKYFMFHYKCL